RPEAPQREAPASSDRAARRHQEMGMLSIRPQHVVVAALAAAILGPGSLGGPQRTARADTPSGDVLIPIKGPIRTLYPIAVPASEVGDATAAREIAQVAAFGLSVAGVFKVLDPAGFLADLKAEGLVIDPQKWKDVGAFGVIKYRATASEIEFRLYEVS